MIERISEILGHIHTRAIDGTPPRHLLVELGRTYPECTFSYTDVDESPYADGTHVTKYDAENWIIIRPKKEESKTTIPFGVVAGEFGKNKNVDDLRKALTDWKNSIDLQRELMEMLAATHRFYYDGLIKQKFTPKEALELTRARTAGGF